MYKKFISAVCLVLVSSLTGTGISAQGLDLPTSEALDLPEHVPGEILIRFQPWLNSDQASLQMEKLDLIPMREIPPLGVHLVKLPQGQTVEQAVTRFGHLPGVEFAEPNYIMQIAAIPQSEIIDQWGLTKIQTQEAWNTLDENQKNEILLATVDTGIDSSQSDLSSNIWYFPGEVPGNSIDDDNNGYVDDTWGWDFVNNDNDPSDDNMHGTAVSSVMAGILDGVGVVGICPWCKVLAVKALGANGTGTLDVVASGITYAAQNGARVINLSLVGPAGSQTLENAVNFAWNEGAVVVAAAGNDGLKTTLYPAGYANAISVASTNSEDNHSCFSNYNNGYISVAAPGESIYVIDINNTETGYGYYSGTSLSAPHVAGLAGLLFGKDPALDNTQVRSMIENSTVDLGPPGIDAAFGSGRINAYRAITENYTPITPPDGLFSMSDTASGYAHARKLVRDIYGTLHLIWHTDDGSLYRIRHATSSDNGSSWDLRPDVFSSQNETYHPALAADGDYLYVAIPSRTGPGLPYQILFTRKPLIGGTWTSADSLISGTYNAVRPDIYIDPSNGRLHVIASSLDDAPDLYYRASNTQGDTWEISSQFNPSNSTANTRYASIHANGDNIYIATRTVSNLFLFTYYYLHTARSINGGITWIDQTKISSYLALATGEYGVSLAGVGDRLYMGYEVGSNLYFRRYDGAVWSDYLQLEAGEPTNENPIVYKWPSITQADDGQAWLLFQMRGDLYMRHYDGSNWEGKVNLGRGSYANSKLGAQGGLVEWVSTNCNGSPFDLIYDSLSLSGNSPPQANDQSVSTNEDTPVNISLSGSDPEGEPLTYSIVSNPSNGVLTGAPPNVVYTPSENYYGADSFTFNVNDGQLDSAPATVTLTINPVNDPPLANDDIVTTPEDTPVAITLTGSDPEGIPLTFSVVSNPSNGNLSGSPPDVIYSPNQNYYGADSFTFTANDGTTDSLLATVFITVNSVNDIPVANDDSVNTPEDTPVDITLTGSDQDSDPLTFSIVSNPSHGTLIGSPPILTYTPLNGYSGSDSFTFVVNDGVLNSAPGTVSITITGSSMHVSDLDSQAISKPRNHWDAFVSISVHDSSHNPVTGATVTGSWSAGATGGVSCVTFSNGACSVSKNNLKGNISSVTFTVDDISHASLVYKSSTNHDPDADSDGTEIIVYQDGSPGNQPPLATFTYSCTGLLCDFNASGSYDPDGSISSYAWDFGDGNAGSGVIVSHTYDNQGTYSVVLTVVDDQGASSSDSQQVFFGEVQYMHVGDLEGRTEPGRRDRWNALVDIFVHDVSDESVAGVTVSGSWTSGADGSCITKVNGWCTITLANIKNSVSSVNFSITDLIADGWIFDFQSNHDLDGDSNGTLITINH